MNIFRFGQVVTFTDQVEKTPHLFCRFDISWIFGVTDIFFMPRQGQEEAVLTVQIWKCHLKAIISLQVDCN